MKKLVLNVIAAVLMMVGLGSIATLSPAYADKTAFCANGKPATDGDISNCEEWQGTGGISNNDDLLGILTTIINVIVGVIGFVAVVMIVIGGIGFVTSQGDTSKVAKARNTILYGVVGLVVALLAFAIVNFVLGAVFSNS